MSTNLNIVKGFMIPLMLFYIVMTSILTGNCLYAESHQNHNPLSSPSIFGIDLSLSPDDDTFPGYNHDLIIQRISEMGVKWVRETFMQSGIEYPRRTYHWEEYDSVVTLWQRYDIDMIGTIYGSSNFTGPMRDDTGRRRLVPSDSGYGNAVSTLEEWWNFVGEVVERYDGDGYRDMPGLKYPIKYWESWNEPNQVNNPGKDGFWYQKWPDSLNTQDLKYLLKLQKGFYKSVNKADSTAIVIGPSVLTRSSYSTDHRKEFYCHPDVHDYFDIVNYHKNRLYSWENWDSSTVCVNDKPVWFTETNRHKLTGETDHDNDIEYLKLFIEGGYLTGSRMIRIYHYFGDGVKNKYIDITSPDYPLKPMGVYMKTLLQQLDNSVPEENSNNENWRSFKFSKKNGYVYALWSKADSIDISMSVQSKLIKIIRYDGEEKIISNDGNAVALTLTKEPVYLIDSEFTEVVNFKQRKNIPDKYKLLQNYPNPFNPDTKISYSLPKTEKVTLTIYNLHGQTIDIVIDEKQAAGNYQIIWDAGNLSSGIYFYELKVKGFCQKKKMLLLR